MATVKQLWDTLKEKGIKFTTKMKKAELEKLLKKAEKPAKVAKPGTVGAFNDEY